VVIKKILIIFFLTIAVSIELFSQTDSNPFYGGNTKKHSTAVRKPFFRNSTFYKNIASWQKILRDRIAQYILSLKNGDNRYSILIILGICFFYGVIHALGPGHRKTVMFSYFMANDARPYHGILAGLGLSILHASSALILILSLYIFVRHDFLPKKIQFELIMEEVSYGSIAILGFILIILKLFSIVRKKKNKEQDDPVRVKRLIPLILTAGIVPCPGASSILIFSLAAGFVTIGIFGVLTMSLGMAVSISSISVIAILGKKKLLNVMENHSKIKFLIQEGIELSGALIIFLFGIFMFLPFLNIGRPL